MNRGIPTGLAVLVGVWVFFVGPAGLRAQDAGVAIEPGRLALSDKDVLDQAIKLHEAGKLMDYTKVREWLRNPKGAKLDLPAVSTRPLAPRAIAARGRKALVRVGWFYKCPKCSKWHLNFAGGYAIADGAIRNLLRFPRVVLGEQSGRPGRRDSTSPRKGAMRCDGWRSWRSCWVRGR